MLNNRITGGMYSRRSNVCAPEEHDAAIPRVRDVVEDLEEYPTIELLNAMVAAYEIA